MELDRPAPHPAFELQFGPTVVATLEANGNPLPSPDFSKAFVSHSGFRGTLLHREVGLLEVLNGLEVVDTRLRDAIVRFAREAQ